jgi:hypothetical protein
MDQPEKTVGGQPSSPEQDNQPDQQSGTGRDQATHVIEPPKPEPHDSNKDDPNRPTTERREGVVSDPDVP